MRIEMIIKADNDKHPDPKNDTLPIALKGQQLTFDFYVNSRRDESCRKGATAEVADANSSPPETLR